MSMKTHILLRRAGRDQYGVTLDDLNRLALSLEKKNAGGEPQKTSAPRAHEERNAATRQIKPSPELENLVAQFSPTSGREPCAMPDPNDVLQMDYEVYLQSSQWKTIRRRILKRDKGLCVRCGGKATLVHHRAYTPEVLEGNADHLLASLCEGCHNIVEFNDHGVRRSSAEKERILLEKDERVTFPQPKVDLRLAFQKKPDDWSRMTAIQRDRWHTRVFELICEKKMARGHKGFGEILLKKMRAKK